MHRLLLHALGQPGDASGQSIGAALPGHLMVVAAISEAVIQRRWRAILHLVGRIAETSSGTAHN